MKKLRIFARPFNKPHHLLIWFEDMTSTTLAEYVKKSGVTYDKLARIFGIDPESPHPYGSYEGLKPCMIRDAEKWSELAALLNAELNVERQDPQEPGCAYPVAIYWPDGRYQVTALFPRWQRRMHKIRKFFNCLPKAKKGRGISYESYDGFA